MEDNYMDIKDYQFGFLERSINYNGKKIDKYSNDYQDFLRNSDITMHINRMIDLINDLDSIKIKYDGNKILVSKGSVYINKNLAEILYYLYKDGVTYFDVMLKNAEKQINEYEIYLWKNQKTATKIMSEDELNKRLK